ncbi:MAG: bifunctional hydroxymethylpyrimidine kinase/phosphomethylpyrimidine kinase [Planctomycetota bacterium]|nr:bifunctional hydroxymethylpyrimidine kinase/phosphomethylpyrimidine kinase [Planctomycetota bacterium]
MAPAARETARVPLRLLLIGGEDSSGRAGLGADRETVALLSRDLPPGMTLSALTVPTAHTVQSGMELHELGARKAEEWGAEVRHILADPQKSPAAAKFGLLPGRAHLEMAAEIIRELAPRCPVVLDPVAGTSGGSPFLSRSDLSFLLEHVLPAGPILTPNIPEAALLTASDPRQLASDPAPRLDAAASLLRAGAAAVLLKGGHGIEDQIQDLLAQPGSEPSWIRHPRIPGPGLRGSGCRHASALAVGLAQGQSLIQAARGASAHLAGLMGRRT